MKTLGAMVDQMIRLLGRFLSYWGVDARQYHALLIASLKIDFRSENLMPDVEKQGATASALTWTVTLYLLFSAIFAGLLTITDLGREMFTGLLFSYSMFMLATAIMIEFGSTVINPDDLQFIRSRPVSSRTYFAVKFSNLLFYILIFGVALNVLPALIGRHYADTWLLFPVVYFLVALLSSLFMAGVIVALYDALLRLVKPERFKDILTYVQIAFSFSFFFGYQMLYQYVDAWRQAGATVFNSPWAAAVPPFWFAGLVEVLLGRVDRVTLMLAALALVSIAFFGFVLIKSVSLGYTERIHQATSDTDRQKMVRSAPHAVGPLTRLVDRLLLRDAEERAFFHLILAMLRRSRSLKLRLYPTVGIALALSVLSIFQYKKTAGMFAQAQPFFLFWSLMAFPFAANGLYAVLPYSDEYQGHWIFRAAPLMQPARVLSAIRKASLLGVFLPLLLINTLMLSYLWPVAQAFWHSVYGVLVGYLTMQLFLFRLSDFPFSRPFHKGQQQYELIVMFLAVMGLIVALIFLARWLAGHWLALFSTMLLLTIACFVLSRLSDHVYARRLRRRETASEPQPPLGRLFG
jgi:hypothetical protein